MHGTFLCFVCVVAALQEITKEKNDRDQYPNVQAKMRCISFPCFVCVADLSRKLRMISGNFRFSKKGRGQSLGSRFLTFQHFTIKIPAINQFSSTGIQQNGTVYFIYFFEVLRRFNYLYLKGYITTLSSFQFCRQLYQKIRYRVNIELPRDGFSNENFGSC